MAKAFARHGQHWVLNAARVLDHQWRFADVPHVFAKLTATVHRLIVNETKDG